MTVHSSRHSTSFRQNLGGHFTLPHCKTYCFQNVFMNACAFYFFSHSIFQFLVIKFFKPVVIILFNFLSLYNSAEILRKTSFHKQIYPSVHPSVHPSVCHAGYVQLQLLPLLWFSYDLIRWHRNSMLHTTINWSNIKVKVNNWTLTHLRPDFLILFPKNQFQIPVLREEKMSWQFVVARFLSTQYKNPKRLSCLWWFLFIDRTRTKGKCQDDTGHHTGHHKSFMRPSKI